MLRDRRHPYRAVPTRVLLPDGDVTVLHDDRPDGWQPTHPTAVLLHGLTGCHASSYMVQAARRLNEAGVRTFRMDMRACGAAEGLSRLPYHGGCSDDLLVALERVSTICPASPISLVGFSIGGNTVLKMAGENVDHVPPELNRLIAINPPIDLGFCVDRFSHGASRAYDRYLAKVHYRRLLQSDSLIKHANHNASASRPHGQQEFDQWYTAKVWGFETVEQFYAATSSIRTIPDIRIPTLLIASRDDPLVPVELFESLNSLNSINLHLTDHGGHLGFIGRPGVDPDCRWMDWRIVDCITGAQTTSLAKAA